MKLIGIGDNVCDMYIHLKTMYPGGQAFNVAVYGKMLGVESAYMGVFGNDEVAEHNLATLDEFQIDYSHCRHYNEDNGFAMVKLIDGERVFIGGNRCGALRKHPLNLNNEDLQYVRQFSVIHTSNNSFIDKQLEKLYSTNIPISYDFSKQWEQNRDWMSSIAPYCNFGFFSLSEDTNQDAITAHCREFYKAGCRNVIVTFGSKGSCFYDGKDYYFKEPHLVRAIDTLGAGDSFAAAFLVNYFKASEAAPDQMIKGTPYYQGAIRQALYEAADFSSQTCLVLGAFAHGKTIVPEVYLDKLKSLTENNSRC